METRKDAYIVVLEYTSDPENEGLGGTRRFSVFSSEAQFKKTIPDARLERVVARGIASDDIDDYMRKRK